MPSLNQKSPDDEGGVFYGHTLGIKWQIFMRNKECLWCNALPLSFLAG